MRIRRLHRCHSSEAELLGGTEVISWTTCIKTSTNRNKEPGIHTSTRARNRTLVEILQSRTILLTCEAKKEQKAFSGHSTRDGGQ